MRSEEIRKKFLEFFEKRGHKVVPSSSLIPDDPSVLLTTAGMQQFKRYFTGELNPKNDFGSLNTASVQESFRTSDIDEVGDASHLTFFEMLGNFSFGGYFKEKAIVYGYEFITKGMELKIDKVTIFDPKKVPAGDWRKGVPLDKESESFWQNHPVQVERSGIDNFWGPTGGEGPCGSTTEIYVKNVAGESVEIWNIVFNEFYCDKNKKLTPLKTPGVDTGMGLERLAMVSQKVPTIFETDLFKALFDIVEANIIPIREKRIIVDHIRGSVFLLADGVRPSNKEAGYILRRLIRRVLVYSNQFEISNDTLEIMINLIIKQYGDFYKECEVQKEEILKEFKEEKERFSKTLTRGVSELKKIDAINAKNAFGLYETFGVPYEIIKEFGGEKAKKLNREDFDKEFMKHQEISRAGVEKKFGGHGLLLDTGELKAGSEEELKKVTRLHTATHLLNQALREVLGDEVTQRGSDITTERTRFDFTFTRKMTPEEIKKVEAIVNVKIKEDLPVGFKEMSKTEAEKTGALHFFKAKYPERVKVYYVGYSLDKAWSKEFCGGPHVTRTGEIGKFKIVKEEASSAGIRRIRAVVD